MSARRLLTAFACVVLLAGCGGGAATGSGVNTKTTGGPGSLFGSSAPATVKPTIAAPKPKPKPVVTKAAPAPVRTRAAAPAPAPPPQQVTTFRITINGDKSGKALLDPPQAAVISGTKVIWTNADSVPRGVQAQNGAFNSGKIPPGGSYTWIAGAAGMYAYDDSTRPYVNAQIQVSPR